MFYNQAHSFTWGQWGLYAASLLFVDVGIWFLAQHNEHRQEYIGVDADTRRDADLDDVCGEAPTTMDAAYVPIRRPRHTEDHITDRPVVLEEAEL